MEETELKFPDSTTQPDPSASAHAGQFKSKSVASTRTLPRWFPLAGGALALLLAGIAEVMIEAKSKTMASLALYLAAIALFAISAWPLPPITVDLPVKNAATEQPQPAGRRRAWTILGGGIGIAILLSCLALFQVSRELHSLIGVYLWLASLIAIGAVGIVTARLFGWAPRWGAGVFPSNPRDRWILLAVVLVIIGVAAAARLIGLEQLPVGINADEGDRASKAIQVIRGNETQSIFGTGWYWISMLYFWLLAQLMQVIGIGFAQARVFGALFSIASVAIVTWIGMRNFVVRVGLMAGALLSLLGVSLQFARETSEAGPTATLWALSVMFFLEAARTGKTWAWIGAGMAGGFAIYFYPSGRLWAVVAAIFCVYLFIHGLGGRRRPIVMGTLLAALSSLMVMGPFLVHGLQDMHIMTLRAQETSIFTDNNVSRLIYYDPDWSILQLLAAQVERSVGIFHEYYDAGGFWPTDRPLMSGLLAMLTLLGAGWVATRWRDPRYVLLAVWFWVGLTGMIVTVETPNLQRMATAVPMIALLPALVLDSMVRRLEVLSWRGLRLQAKRWWPVATGLALALVVGFMMWGQYYYYFGYYATVDHWPVPTIQGQAVNSQGSDTLVASVSRKYHMVNSGWVRLLAPFTPRGGIKAPGSDLPLTEPTDKNLAFMIFPKEAVFQEKAYLQHAYLPYLRSLYPGGTTKEFRYNNPDSLITTIYRVPKDQWAATQGAMVEAQGAEATRVAELGMPPPGWSRFPASMIWRAGLRAPRYWNYNFRAGPGPAKLTIDGVEVLTVPAGQESAEATVSLARGDHYLEYRGNVTAEEQPARLEWAEVTPIVQDTEPRVDWRKPHTEELISDMTAPRGLFATVHITGTTGTDNQRADMQRIDNTVATCCLAQQIRAEAKRYSSRWLGSLLAPTTGTYSMTLFTTGLANLKIDDKSVVDIATPSETPASGTIHLTAGPHKVEIAFHGEGAPGSIEWAWKPPGEEESIVPPSALSPPPGAGVGPIITPLRLGSPDDQPIDGPLYIVP